VSATAAAVTVLTSFQRFSSVLATRRRAGRQDQRAKSTTSIRGPTVPRFGFIPDGYKIDFTITRSSSSLEDLMATFSQNCKGVPEPRTVFGGPGLGSGLQLPDRRSRDTYR